MFNYGFVWEFIAKQNGIKWVNYKIENNGMKKRRKKGWVFPPIPPNFEREREREGKKSF